jgi:hypothetical protein
LNRLTIPICLLFLACGDDGTPAEPDALLDDPVEEVSTAPTPLIDHESWLILGADDDPFTDRPADVEECPDESAQDEELGGAQVFSVLTGACPYLTASQPILADVASGDPIRIRVFHFELTSPEGGEAHIAISIGETLIWEQRTAIPADSDGIDETIIAPDDLPAGTPIYFHLHNHGANEWALIEVLIDG